MGCCLIPAAIFLCSPSSAQKLPLALLVSHYAYRSFIYPFWLQQPKQTPFHIWLAACCFVTCNSVLQVRGKFGTHLLGGTALHAPVAWCKAKHRLNPQCLAPWHLIYAGTSSCSCGHAMLLRWQHVCDCHMGINATMTCRAHSWCTVSVSQSHWCH